MTRWILQVPLLLCAASPLATGQEAGSDPAGTEFFESRIRPVLAGRCIECHREPASKAKGGLSLESREGLLKGGNSGPAIRPGDPGGSVLIQAIRGINEDLKMPPKGKGRLSAAQIADFEEWVRRGAPDPRAGGGPSVPSRPVPDPSRGRGFWSFRPVADPSLPEVRDKAWPANSVDRFILAKLEERGLRPAADAGKLTLLRRATFDLTGLPPTPDEAAAFQEDDAPGAFERVLERLLASPRYGERWGRHWLDLVRYADTAGDNSDFPVPQAYRYRDYVIRAFNEDKPYGRFLREQIAGDLLPFRSEEERHELIVATGYIALARRFGTLIVDYNPHQIIEDSLDTLGRSVLGLTLGCARCHDHKFDPLTQGEYYGLYGIFESTRYPFPGLEETPIPRDFVPLMPKERLDGILRAFREKLDPLDARVRRLKDEREALLEKARSGEISAIDAAGRLRTAEEAINRARKERDDVARNPPPVESAYAVVDAERTGNARIHVKGDPRILGAEAPRGFPAVLGGDPSPGVLSGSGRLELAQWVADPRNPLSSRVLVNRLWQHHFGEGIVRTPSDFGARGLPPTHPELLDFLARRFLESGGSIKAMHRLLMTSRTYRLAGGDDPRNAEADPDNLLRWKFGRRRLEAEAIRDAMLSVSGALDLATGGPHPFPPQQTWKFSQHKPFTAVYETNRRSVYLMTQRFRRHPFLALFDGADPNATTPQRTASITALQALYMMNDPFVRAQARGFAARLLGVPGGDGDRIERAYLLAFGRPPSEEERSAGEAFVRAAPGQGPPSAAWTAYAHALFSLNEFVFVD